jgi:protein TonB
VAALRPKAFANSVDIISVNIRKENPMKFLWHAVALIAVLGAIALAQDTPKKITRAEAIGAIAIKVQPDYPAMAKQLKIQGTVELEALVTETGTVANVEIVSGNPLLTAPSVQAVKRWKFKPFMEDGKAIRVLAPISLDYKL